jgi:cell division protein FtsQ
VWQRHQIIPQVLEALSTPTAGAVHAAPTPLPAPDQVRPIATRPDRGVETPVRQVGPPVERTPRRRERRGPRRSSHRPADASLGVVAARIDEPADIPVGEEGRLSACAKCGRPHGRGAALRAEVRRFTARQRRRRMTWIVAGSALLLLVLGTLGVAYSPLFAVQQITVVGTSRWIPRPSRPRWTGSWAPLPLVDSSAVKAALVKFPLVESYSLEARPPRARGAHRGAHSDRVHSDSAPASLWWMPRVSPCRPRLSRPRASRAHRDRRAVLTRLQRRRNGLPSPPDDIRAQVTAIAATSPNDVTLTLGSGGTTVVWGNADASPLKAKNLAAIMTARPGARFDVSSPTQSSFGSPRHGFLRDTPSLSVGGGLPHTFNQGIAY